MQEIDVFDEYVVCASWPINSGIWFNCLLMVSVYTIESAQLWNIYLKPFKFNSVPNAYMEVVEPITWYLRGAQVEPSKEAVLSFIKSTYGTERFATLFNLKADCTAWKDIPFQTTECEQAKSGRLMDALGNTCFSSPVIFRSFVTEKPWMEEMESLNLPTPFLAMVLASNISIKEGLPELRIPENTFSLLNGEHCTILRFVERLNLVLSDGGAFNSGLIKTSTFIERIQMGLDFVAAIVDLEQIDKYDSNAPVRYSAEPDKRVKIFAYDEAWTAYFECVAWDHTYIIIDYYQSRIHFLCTTDTD